MSGAVLRAVRVQLGGAPATAVNLRRRRSFIAEAVERGRGAASKLPLPQKVGTHAQVQSYQPP
jgi:hypothetical protein